LHNFLLYLCSNYRFNNHTFILNIYEIIYYFSDTAAVYHNETDIKEALKVLLPKYHLKRDDLFITSKLGIQFSTINLKCSSRRVIS